MSESTSDRVPDGKNKVIMKISNLIPIAVIGAAATLAPFDARAEESEA